MTVTNKILDPGVLKLQQIWSLQYTYFAWTTVCKMSATIRARIQIFEGFSDKFDVT